MHLSVYLFMDPSIRQICESKELLGLLESELAPWECDLLEEGTRRTVPPRNEQKLWSDPRGSSGA